MSRTLLSIAAMCVLAFLAGCAAHETYGDRAIPGPERVIIEGYSRYHFLYFEDLQIVSVDGKREGGQRGWPYASSVSVPAGRHWLQLMILRNSSDIATCAFEWTFEVNHAYKLQHVDHEQVLLAHPSSSRFPASVSIVVTAPSQATQHLHARAECGKAASCRQASDCPAQQECQMDPGFEFGACKSQDR